MDSLAQRSERLRFTVTKFQRFVVDDLDKLGSRVSLLHDNIDQDPGIVDFPLHNPWEGLYFLKTSFSETISKMLPVLKQKNCPIVFVTGSGNRRKFVSVSISFTSFSSFEGFKY